jgi:hypothetical protein
MNAFDSFEHDHGHKRSQAYQQYRLHTKANMGSDLDLYTSRTMHAYEPLTHYEMPVIFTR